MPINLDRRTRDDADVRFTTPADFFADQFPDLVEANGAMVAFAIDRLDAPPLGLEIDGSTYTITGDGESIAVHDGIKSGAIVVTLSADQFSDWVQNQLTFNGMMVARQFHLRDGELAHASIWDSLWSSLLIGWPVVDDAVTFVDRFGAPLDLNASFGPHDDPADINHFLRETGYLSLRGWLDAADMETISHDMDVAMPTYVEGDGKSWWATLADGSRPCVRMQEFVDHSPTTARVLSSEVWDHLRQVIGGEQELVRAPVEGRIIEALFKPIGVVSGPSDVTFHRDCHLGRHSYDCANFTVGIAVTATSQANGSLRVIAGSHRVLVPVEIAKTRPYMPVVSLPTEPGDLTVHLSCTLHEATPPRVAERRVMYTGFSLPPRSADAGRAGNDALSRLRESVNDILRDGDADADSDA